MAVPTIIGVQEASVTGTAADTISINVPAGVVAGDVLFAFLTGANPLQTVYAPSGWTLLTEGYDNGAKAMNLYKIVEAGDLPLPSSVTFNWYGWYGQENGTGCGCMIAVRGCNTDSLIDANVKSFGFSSSNLPAFTVNNDDGLGLLFFVNDLGAGDDINTSPPSPTLTVVSSQDAGNAGYRLRSATYAAGSYPLFNYRPGGAEDSFIQIIVLNSGGDSGPSISSILPNSGTTLGGTSVTIMGSAFDDATGVSFGGDPATDFIVVDSNTITCKTPAHAEELVDVVVHFPSSDLTVVDGFEYVAPVPTVIEISPDRGLATGGTTVTIIGTLLADATGILFDGEPVTDFTIISPETLQGVTPAHIVATVDVTVELPTGDIVLPNAFEYLSSLTSMEARVTQLPLIVLDVSSQPSHVTQIPIIILGAPSQSSRVTQFVVTAVATPKPVPPPLPYIPDVPITEYWEYATAVVETENGREKRDSLRANPRINLKTISTITDENERRFAVNQIKKNLGKTFSYPLFQYSTTLTDKVELGSNVAYFDTLFANVRVGEAVAFIDPITERFIFNKIVAIAADHVELIDQVSEEIPSHFCVAPVQDFVFLSSAGVSMSSISGESELELYGVGSRTVKRAAQSNDLVTMYDGLLVLDKRPSANSSVDDIYDKNVEWLNNGLAPPIPRTVRQTPRFNGAREYSTSRGIGLDYWREFCDKTRGRWKSFLTSTYRNDLPVIGYGVSEFETNNLDLADLYLSPMWRYLCFELSDRSTHFRRILDVVTNYDVEGNPYSLTVKLNSNLPSMNGTIVSYAPLCRLNADVVEIEHGVLSSVIAFEITTAET